LARELAALRKVSLVTAVTEALREKVSEEKSKLEPETRKTRLAERLMKLSHETAPLMNDGRTSKELMDELYDDETGLPK
jgi:hypothetical protein